MRNSFNALMVFLLKSVFGSLKAFRCGVSPIRNHQKVVSIGSDQHLEGVQSACDPGNGEAGATEAAEVNDFAKIMTTLSTEFLLRVYLRTHLSLREDLLLWKV